MPNSQFKTAVVAIGVLLLPLATWTLYTTATNASEINVLKTEKSVIVERLDKMEDRLSDKLDKISEEQQKVRIELAKKIPGEASRFPTINKREAP